MKKKLFIPIILAVMLIGTFFIVNGLQNTKEGKSFFNLDSTFVESLKSFATINEEKRISDNTLKEMGVEGMRITEFYVDETKITKLDYEENEFKLENDFIKLRKGVEQDIYLRNNKLSDEVFAFSTVIEIDYSEIRWNGTRYILTETPIKLTSWIDKESGNLVVPNIFMDDKFHKRINYKDLAEKGGYAIAYEKDGKYYIELKIDGLEIKSQEKYYIDPVYVNMTDGFPYLAEFGGDVSGIGYNDSDFWFTNAGKDFVWHTDGKGNNITDGFKITVPECLDPQGLKVNRGAVTDIYTISQSFDAICNLNQAGVNQSGGFDVAPAGMGTAVGLAYNGSDFWSIDDPKRFVFHFSATGENLTGIAPIYLGADRALGVAVNTTDIWIQDLTDSFIYHATHAGVNITDGFPQSLVGSSSVARLVTSSNGEEIYLSDGVDDFVYHASLNITLDTIPPNVTILSPENITYSVPIINFTIKAEDETKLDSCWVTVDDGITNNSMFNTTSNPNYYNYSAPFVYSAGGYLAEFYCNDSMGNVNDTESISFGVLVASITIVYPNNNTNWSDVELDVNYTYATAISCWYSNDSYTKNTSFASCGENLTTIIWSEGLHNVTVWARDAGGNEDSSRVSFTIDTIDPLLNIVSPINNTNHTTSTLNINFTRSDANLESCWYSNDTFEINTTLAGCTNISGATEVTWSEGSHHIRIWVNDSVGNEVVDSVTFLIDTINPDINITFPINNTNHSNSGLNVNYTVSDTNLADCWYSNDTYEVNTTLTDCGTNITDVVWSEGQHNVTVWVNDTFGNENASRISFTIDTTVPAVNITYPFNTVDYQIVDTNLTINYTAPDTHLESCWGSFDGGTNNLSLTCADQNITINVTSLNNNTFTLWANDTFGNVGKITRTWIYKIFEVEQIFSSTTIPGSTETFVNDIFLGSGEIITEVNFNYNGTDISAGYSDLGGNEYNLSSAFVIPAVSTGTNITFFWKIDLISGQINTTSKNQSIRNIAIDDCSVFSTLLFNYTIIGEESQTKLTVNTSLELDIEIFDSSKTILILNFSQEYIDTNPATVCLNINLTESTDYSLDSTAKYSAANHSIEYYSIQNFLLQNATIPQHIKLYDLLIVDATEFQITFKDSNFVTVENALVQINRQYLSEGVFKTVEIPKTDSNGQTVAHLVEKDVVYNILVLKEGEVLGTFNNVIAFCEDVLIGSCFITLNALVKGEVSFDYDEEIELFYDFDYNETSRNLRFDFTTTDGSVKNVTLSAIKFDQLGETDVCDGFLISSGGSIYCPVPISVGNESIIISIWVDGDLKITNYVRAGREFDIGDAGYFLMFFLVLSLALMMTQSKTGVIIGVILGFIAGTLLSFIQGGLMGIGSSVIWLIIMGVILIYKLNSQGQT